MAIKIRIVSDFDAKGITKANQALNDMGKAAGVALAAVGVAMVGIGVKSVQEFAKFDAALVKSKAIMGDLTEALEKDMSNAAREVAKVTTFSAEQAAESYFFLASAGLDAKSSMMALPQVAQFAQAGMFDMALATDLLTDAQSALGLTIRDDAVKNMENMVKVSDVLVRANTLANASVEQFSIALTTKAGAALRALGKDVEEGVAVLAAFADQGIKGEMAGTQLSIVLRDLTTKAINNKDAFDKMGIAVFDSNGEMNNLGGIIGNLEVALAGMSDETQKATLLQLGFSDKSLASLQALLGTSEAIKTYEKELRSASGFTGDVANKQLDSFESQLKLLESAFIDVAIQIGEELTPYLKDLIPVIQRVLPEIGEKMAAAVAQVDWEKLAEDVADFIGNFVENIDNIVKVAQAIGILAAGLVAYTTVAKIAIAHAAIMNSTLILNPYVLATVALVGLTAALVANNGALEENINNYKQLQSQTDKTNYAQKNLADNYRESAYVAGKYAIETDDLRDANLKLAGAADMVSGEITRFNNLKLDGVKSQIRGVNQAILDMYHSGVAATAVFEGVIDFRTGKGIDFIKPITSAISTSGSGGGGGGGGPTPAELAAEQFEKVQGIIKRASDEMWSAQRKYQERVTDAQSAFQKRSATIADKFTQDVVDATKNRNQSLEKAFSDHVNSMVDIEQTAANKLSKIISDSKKSLTDAYFQATSVTISGILKAFNSAEDERAKAFDNAAKDAEKNKKAFDEVFSYGDPVAALRDALAAQVQSNKKLADQSAALYSAGFSQTFIEQMLAAGADGGEAIADALLDATPETRASIQQLFSQIETQSRTGLDALADQIYETAGLATQELRDLYTLTQAELILSLENQRFAYEQQVTDIESVYASTLQAVTDARNAAMSEAHSALMDEMREAQSALGTALDAIEKEFKDSITALEGNLAGLGSTIDKLLAKFGALKTAAGQKTEQVGSTTPKPEPTPEPAPVTGALAGFTQVGTLTGQAINGITGILVDSASDLQKIMVYLAERINAAQRFASLEAKTPEEAANARMLATLFAEQAATVTALAGRPDKGVGTVININVKADTSQSLAMVGRSLGNTVAKYVTGGGQVIVSPV